MVHLVQVWNRLGTVQEQVWYRSETKPSVDTDQTVIRHCPGIDQTLICELHIVLSNTGTLKLLGKLPDRLLGMLLRKLLGMLLDRVTGQVTGQLTEQSHRTEPPDKVTGQSQFTVRNPCCRTPRGDFQKLLPLLLQPRSPQCEDALR